MRSACLLLLAAAAVSAGSLALPKDYEQRAAQLHRFTLATAGVKEDYPRPAFPERTIQPAVPEVAAAGCKPGFTGPVCENPICYNQTTIVYHDGENEGLGETVDFDYAPTCSERRTFPVDSTMKDIYVMVDSLGSGRPNAKLYDPTGAPVVACGDLSVSDQQTLVMFCDVVLTTGPGMYQVEMDSNTDEGCTFTITAPTKIAADGGFVDDQRDDHTMFFIPDQNEGIARYPVQNVPSWFAFRLQQDVAPLHPEQFDIYITGRWENQHNLTTRYGCTTPHITTDAYTCTRLEYYHGKITGYDANGNAFQRVYQFDCDANGTPAPPPTGTPAPQTDCYNNGKLVNQQCWCGDFFEGPQCEYPVCFNNGGYNPLNAKCVCRAGYAGDHCEHVHCTQPSQDSFDLNSRALAFVVRSSTSMLAQIDQVVAAAVNITSTYAAYHPSYFQKYVLSVVRNNTVAFTREFEDVNSFIASLRSMTHPPTDTDCADALFLGVSEALNSPALQLYPKSPVFVFSDGSANDEDDVRFKLLSELANFRGQIFFIMSSGSNGMCNMDLTDKGYEDVRAVAAFAQGLAIQVPLSNVGVAAAVLASNNWQQALLMANDQEDCRRLPTYTPFFVDESTNYVVITATGEQLSLLVTPMNQMKFKPELAYQAGNFYAWLIRDTKPGSYLMSLSSLKSGLSACSYRVTAASSYNLFYGITNGLLEDEAAKNPVWKKESHLVAKISNIHLRDPLKISAEVNVWTNGFSGERDILYSSSGVYRDSCKYHMYFGSFYCRVPNMMFYVTVYMKDSSGLTVQRTTTGFCSASAPVPPDVNGCQNGGVGYNGTCICPSHFTGPTCNKVVCENQGTALFGACQCPPGFSGQFCETIACTDFNNYADFRQERRSLSFLVHDSITTRSVIRSIKDTVSGVVNDIQYQHHHWISHYQLLRFNNTDFTTLTDSDDGNALVAGVNTLYNYNRAHSDLSCKDLDLLPTLYALLHDDHISYRGMVYIFVNGIVKTDLTTMFKIMQHVEMMGIQIHVVQISGSPCGQDISNSDVLALLSEQSGGTYHMVMGINAGAVMKSIPTQYNGGLVYENYYTDCSNATFYFPVDSSTQAFTAEVYGELNGVPMYYTPDGDAATGYIVNIWDDLGLSSRMDQVIQACDSHWDQYDNHCWKFGVEPMTWTMAQAVCHMQGASLATIFNKGDQQLLDSTSGNNDYWTGLHSDASQQWVWDTPFNRSMPLSLTNYTNWAAGQPASEVNKCVMDVHAKGQPQGWTTADCGLKKNYVCVKHAYDNMFEPSDPTQDALPRGIWKMSVSAQGFCSVQVRAQSQIQVFAQYTSNVHEDYGRDEPVAGGDNNRVIAHVTGLLPMTRRSLEYAHMYYDNLTIVEAESMKNRDSCQYEAISTPFACPSSFFNMMMTGLDNYGYLYQRIVPVACLSGPTVNSCENGGVYSNGECVCPPNYWGEFCSFAQCQNGGLISADLAFCDCPHGFVGFFCEIPQCSRHGQHPNISKDNKTFVLVLDGVGGGNQQNIISNFNDIATKLLNYASTSFPTWFGSYVGVVFRDANSTANNVPVTSPTIYATNPTDFVAAVQAELAAHVYAQSNSVQRATFTAIAQALSHPAVQPRSLGYIISDGVASDWADLDIVMNEVANTHTMLNLIIAGDASPPGGNYEANGLDALFELTHMSGGGSYQLAVGPTVNANLADELQTILSTHHHSYHILSHHKQNCSTFTEYVQLGNNGSSLLVDVFAQTKPAIAVTDNIGNAVDTVTLLSSKTNTMDAFNTENEQPGIWTLGLDKGAANPGQCMVNVRGLSDLDIYLAFTQDVGEDKGYHSDDATLFPKAGYEMNAILGATNGAKLTYVQVFDQEERRLRFASPMIQRTDCVYPYISKRPFHCNEHSYLIALDGLDYEGHPFRRTYTIHCQGFIPTRAPYTGTPGSRPTRPTPAPTTPAPVYPGCDKASINADVVIVFDSSVTYNQEMFTETIVALKKLNEVSLIDGNHTRAVIGTYDSETRFDADLSNVNSPISFYLALLDAQYDGYTGGDGNNIQSVLEYVKNMKVPFRQGARKMVFFSSSLGWDKGNFYNGQNHGYPDPSADIAQLRAAGVEFYPIGFGDQANMQQLQAISKCAVHVTDAGSIQNAVNQFLSFLCGPTPQC